MMNKFQENPSLVLPKNPYAPVELEDLAPVTKTERQIKAFMVMRGISQKDIALRHQIHPSDVSRVIKGDRRTQKIRRILAQELGLEYELLWPSK